MADLFTLAVPNAEDYRDNILRTIKNGLLARGVLAPAVGKGGDFYVQATAVGNEMTVNAANGIISADQVNEDTATGDNLTTMGDKLYNLLPRPASGSFGPLIASASSPGLVATDLELTDSAGLRYKVSVGGIYSNGDTIPIQAIDAGEATNLPEGSSLQWRTAPAFFAPTALVGIGGLTNGVDGEAEENYRQRILAKKRVPPASGNPQHIAEIAEAASSSVQKAFPYPAVQGPSTNHLALTAAPTATNSSRAINATLLSSIIIPYILGNVSQHTYFVTTGCVDATAKLAIGISIPLAPSASIAGNGGGWLNGSPWPVLAAGPAVVSAYISAVSFTVASDNPPTANVSKIAWYSYSTRKVYKATVASYTGSAGLWAVTIDTPFTGIANGDYIMPLSANVDLYISAILAYFELLGPGEKSSNASALLRGSRFPAPSVAWPYSIGPGMLKALTDSASEASSAQYLYRTSTHNSPITGASGILTPPASDVYATIADPPLIFIPGSIALYPLS